MIEEEVYASSMGCIIFFVFVGFLLLVAYWIYICQIKDKPVKKEPHRFDGRSLKSIILELDQRVMMLEDGIIGLIKRCDGIELGDDRESISKRLDHLGKWVSKIGDKVDKLENDEEVRRV